MPVSTRMPRPQHLTRSIPAALAGSAPSISFEFFPPKDDVGEAVLWEAIRRLEKVRPTFVSVTYGAGGTTRDRTIRITERIARETLLTPLAHLTCVGHSVTELRGVIGSLSDVGIRNILALRGDPQGGPGAEWVRHPEGVDHADELVSLVRSLGEFTVGVAAFPDQHPESPSLDADAVRQVGVEITTELAQELLDDGAPGVHFITMNRSTATLQVFENLGITAAQ
jgi:methylenetetrahydrofolate reductase (NADPH)